MVTSKQYFNTPNLEVIQPENCHPNFLKLFTAPFYYDLMDPESPFGNDYGSDHLFYLEEWYQERQGLLNPVKWMFKTINEYGFKFTAEACSKILDDALLVEIREADPALLEAMDQTIIATCLGQIKITGKIHQALLELALVAVERQEYLQIIQPKALQYLAVLKNDLLSIEQRMVIPTERFE